MKAPVPIVELHGLRKVFRDFWRRPTVAAVRGVELRVRPGEVFGLLGPNGSGKSTTIKLLLGLLHPSGGSVRLFGLPPHAAAARRRIGYLPEISCLHRFLTPVETLHYYAGLFGLDAATTRHRTAELLRMVGLEGAARRPVGELSKGMARRVGLAQALINNPDLIVLDEPTSGLDPIACREVKDWVRRLAGAGKTILMTSHLLADVEDVCDRIAILCDGLVRAEGRCAELLQRPDAIRLTLEGLDNARGEELRRELAMRFDRAVACDRPRIDLESFFLRVVSAAAEEERAATSAAPLAAFLDQPATGPERAAGASATESTP
jgi:ABC-2 type transport system ATP-binding protein